MSEEVSPVEFGRLQAEVQGLRRDNEAQMEMLSALVKDVGDIKLKLAEAGGGWKMLMAIGGASAGLGAYITNLFHSGGIKLP